MSLIGTSVSHYRILDRLGGGGMGIVYRAEDTKLKRQVALKFLPPDLSGDDEANKRFILEAQTASALNHPNICTIHEIGETEDGRMFIAMALYGGRTLKAVLQEADGPLDWNLAVNIAVQLAHGLAAAHEKGIIHRDIKPANIQLMEGGRAILLDFGIAKLSGAVTLTQTGSTLGTIAYMSPEQASAEAIDHRTDLWALGAVLYEMLTGRVPFEGDYDQAVVYNILNTPHTPIGTLRPNLPDPLLKVINRSLDKDRDSRYGSAEELLADLSAVTGGETAFTRPSISPRRRKTIRAATLAVALVGLLSVVYQFCSSGSESKVIESIAVLPLTNLSGDPGQEYFVDGMTDALITELSKIGALHVISRRSIMRYKDSEESVADIASELGVDAVVAGSVIRVDDAVRVNAQLISAGSDENVWAESFDRQLENILALHSDVARSIAQKLRVSLTAAERAGLSSAAEVNPEAYEAYLKGQFHWYRLSPENFESALEQFNLALQIDPRFAAAYAGIARVWGAAGLWGGIEPAVAVEKVNEAVTKALELDDEFSDAYYIQASSKFIYDWDYVGSERAFKRAIELNPQNADWHSLYADLLNSMMRWDEAIQEAKRGVELAPLSSFSHAGLGWVLLCARDYGASLRAHNESLRIEPSMPFALRGRWWLNYHRGDSSAAIADAASFYEIQGLRVVADILRREYPGRGYAKTIRLAAQGLTSMADTTFVPAMRIARLHVHAGEYEKALVLLERSLQERFPSIVAINVDPHWDELRAYARFRVLITRLGLPTR